ncbi:MAG: hypothetical protein MUC58_02435 [Rhizobiaceae bacterium]|nr:hypothetical protein [Rhizobiaceae bacterium]
MIYGDIPEQPIAFDIRIDRAEARRRWSAAHDYSLWRDEPFGASVDAAVWPSAFAQNRSDPFQTIPAPADSAFWSAFGLFDDLAEMLRCVPPEAAAGEIILIGLDREFLHLVPDQTLTSELASSDLIGVDRDQKVHLLGYDICDTFMTSMVFNAQADDELRLLAPSRSPSGLIADRAQALALIPELERRDPGHRPLLVMGVYSLGVLGDRQGA